MLYALEYSDHDGKVIVPEIPSMKIVELAKAVGPDSEVVFSGKRAGEKMHESLIAENEVKAVLLKEDGLVDYRPMPYNSKDNDLWLTPTDLRKKI